MLRSQTGNRIHGKRQPFGFEWRSSLVPALALVLAFSAECREARAQDGVDVLTNRYDPQRTGANLNETTLSPSNVRPGSFGKLFTYTVKGNVYAQALYVSKVPSSSVGAGAPGSAGPVLYIATQHDLVYAFDVPKTGPPPTTPRWCADLTNPHQWGATIDSAISSIPTSDFDIKFDIFTLLAYTDITPEIGITSTPVIDKRAGVMYVVASTKETPKTDGALSNYIHRLHLLDIETGRHVCPPIEIEGSAPGKGDGSSRVVFKPFQQLQRPGLLLSNGVVYVAFGSHGDIALSNAFTVPDYHGWVFAYRLLTDATGSHLERVGDPFVTTPDATTSLMDAFEGNPAGAGIWMSGTGPAVDEHGYLYVATANGAFTASHGGQDVADSALKLRPAMPATNGGAATGPTLIDYFTPHDQACLRTMDRDLGAGGVVVLPKTDSDIFPIVCGGKGGALYLLDRGNNASAHLGGFNQYADTSLQTAPVIPAIGRYGHIHFAPVYWTFRDDLGALHRNLYVMAETDYLRAFELISTGGTGHGSAQLKQRPHSALKALPDSMPGGILALSANGTSGGIIWATLPSDGDANQKIVPGALHAVDAITLKECWNSDTDSDDKLGSFAKFCPPTVADGRVYVPSFTTQDTAGAETQVVVYGLLTGDHIARPSTHIMQEPDTASAAQAVSAMRFRLAPVVPSFRAQEARGVRPADLLRSAPQTGVQPPLEGSLRASRAVWMRDMNRQATINLRYRSGRAGKTKLAVDIANLKTRVSEGAVPALSAPKIDTLLGPLMRSSPASTYPVSRPSGMNVRISSALVPYTAATGRTLTKTPTNTIALHTRYRLAIMDPHGRYHNTIVDSHGHVHPLQFDVAELWEPNPIATPGAPAWKLTDIQALAAPVAQSSAPHMAAHSMSKARANASMNMSMHEDPRYDQDEWLADGVSLIQNPVGFTVHNTRFTDTALIAVPPAGVPAYRFSQLISPTYYAGDGIEVSAGLWGVNRTDSSGLTLYPGIGMQKQLMPDDCPVPLHTALSIGAYGYTGPDTQGGSVYLVGSRLLFGGSPLFPISLYGHAGLKFDAYSSTTSSSGLRPYIGFNAALAPLLYVSGEVRYKQAWERATPYAANLTVHLYRQYGVYVGLENTGYQTVLTLGPAF